MLIQLNLSKHQAKQKPSGTEVMEINAQLQNNTEIQFENFKLLVTEQGRTFTPACLKTPILGTDLSPLIVTQEQFDNNIIKNTKKANINGNIIKQWEINQPIIRRQEICWTSQQLYCIDIDNEIETGNIIDGKKEKVVKTIGYLPWQDALERCKQYNLQPFLIYPSFSFKENHHKFRICFVLDTPVRDFRASKAILLALMKIFPECDPQCKDLNRLFYGTNKGHLFYNLKMRLNINQLFTTLYTVMKQEDATNYARNIETFCKNVGLQMLNNIPAVTTNTALIEGIENKYLHHHSDIFFTFNIDEFTARYKGFKVFTVKNTKTQMEEQILKKSYNFVFYEHLNLNELKDKCQLFNNFTSCQIHIEHNDLCRIMTNLIHAKGGQSFYLDTLEKQLDLYSTNKYNKMKTEMEYAIKQEYHCISCTGCSYEKKCKHGRNMLQQIIIPKGDIVKVDDLKNDYKDINDASVALEQEYIKALAKPVGNITVIKATTGIGKTEIYVNHASAGDMIATPRHNLNQEIIQRFNAIGKNAVQSIARPPLQPKNMQQHYDKMIKMGMIKESSSFYNKCVEKYELQSNRTTEEQLCIDFQQLQQQLKTTNEIIVCTHAKIPAINNQNIKNIIIDEDIFNIQLIKQYNISFQDISNIYMAINNEELKKQVLKIYKDLKDGVWNNKDIIYSNIDLNKQDVNDIKEIIISNSKNYKSEIFQLFNTNNQTFDNLNFEQFNNNLTFIPTYNALKQCTSVQLIKLNKDFFRPDKNYIILSATASEFLYKTLDKAIEFIDIKYTKPTDQIKLYFNETFSSSSIKNITNTNNIANISRPTICEINYIDIIEDDNKANVLKHMKNVIDNRPTICAKGHKKTLKDSTFNVMQDMHFGAVAGLDYLKGMDIAVVGTPHQNTVKYISIAVALGLDCSNTHMSYKLIERNGFKFWFMCYDSVELQEIQLHCIEEELYQSIGRNRSIRNNAEVYVFSNLPLMGMKLMN